MNILLTSNGGFMGSHTSILNKFRWRAKINLYNCIEENMNVN